MPRILSQKQAHDRSCRQRSRTHSQDARRNSQSRCEAIAVPTDVRDEKDVRRLVHETIDRFDQIDALINDAVSYPISIGAFLVGPGATPQQRLLG
jgi:NAD(P)-dependent dehydrogenase (short-subunit alcohol dehydrogenase family)